eukprot:13572336-Alexandrium_andersonii.AAC.1
MTFPAENDMSTCGVGVWIPADTATVEQIAPGAYDYYHHRVSPQGTALYTCFAGVRPSTTRVEAAAVLLALHTLVPLHLATDSNTVFKTVMRMTAGAIDTDARPWSLRPNGDLFEMIEQ